MKMSMFKALEEAVTKLHQVDPGSDSTRYPVTKDGEPSMAETGFLLGAFKDLIEKCAALIEGSYDWVIEGVRFRAEMRREFEEMIGELNF